MAERELLISHPIGTAGRFRLVTSSGSLRIEGADGDVAEVRARYRIPSRIVPEGDDPAMDGVLHVVREEGLLSVQVRDPGANGIIAGFARRMGGVVHPDVDFEVRVPRGATVRLESAAADGEIRGLRGTQEIRSISGDLEVDGAGGRVTVTTVSGDVAIAGDVLSLTANTTSGDISVDAELVETLVSRSVSGDISVRAALGREAIHSFESVSGDLLLATASGLSVELSGLSGSLRTEQPSRRESRDGQRIWIVGDGAARLRARTVSGDVVIGGPSGGPARSRSTADAFGLGPEMAAFGKDMATFGAGLAREISAAMSGIGSAWTASPSGASWPAPPAPPVPPRPPEAVTVPVAPPGTTGERQPAAGGDQLAILRLLEAGEIDVDEAARRLEALA